MNAESQDLGTAPVANEITTDVEPNRALILAGGGLKVAFQAGVLQVWLDEANLEFDHVDAASGGVFNLAMLVQGMSGTRIADNWRQFRPLRNVQPNFRELLKGPFAASWLRYDRFRRVAFRSWGLDWDALRSSEQQATFNAYNFSRHELAVIEPKDMTEDLLVASVSLPMFFPPVEVDGETLLDAVYVTDANIEEAITRGADELWIIWTVSSSGTWRNGFIAQYFQIIESSAVGDLRRILRRIDVNNKLAAAGQHSEFGRHIEVKMLEHEVPIHYLLNLNADRSSAAVELGVAEARRWCRANGIPLKTDSQTASASTPSTPTEDDMTGISFTETMHGNISFAADEGLASTDADELHRLRFWLTIDVDGIDRFVSQPDHAATATGSVICGALGGELSVEAATFNLLQDASGPGDQRMRYRLHFRDHSGRPLTLSGYKVVADDEGADLWPDTTTLFVTIFEGYVEADEEADATTVASGTLRLTGRDFLRQLTTVRVTAPSLAKRASVLARFGRLFFARVWDVYGRRTMKYGPI